MDLPNINFEHNPVLKAENIPALLMFVLFGVMMIPTIPPDTKSFIMFGGMIAFFPLIIAVDAYGQVKAAQVTTIKARIMPFKIEKEFHIEKTIGKISSSYNPATGANITPFKLAVPTNLSELKLPDVDEIEIEHKLPWETRNKQCKAWVHWKGIEVQSPNVYLVELWYKGERRLKVGSTTDFLGFVPRFRLARGSEDFWLVDGEPVDERLMQEPLTA